jgi:hypothetical protein
MLHQGLEEKDFQWLEQKYEALRAKGSTVRDTKQPIKIAYAGTILVEKEFEMFVRFLDSLQLQASKALNASTVKTSRKIELHFWGAHSYASRSWFRPEWMFEHGNLPEQRLIDALRECDWGFIPMALDDDEPRYNRFSFPTKFITYLAAGLSPIVVGHPESSVVKFCESWFQAFVITERQVLLLASEQKQLNKQLFSSNVYSILPLIISCARKHFSADSMRQRLHACISLSSICIR